MSIDSGKDVVIPGVSHVIRPAATTNTGFLRYEPLDNSYSTVLELTRKFLKETGYSGLFSMEFLRGKDGKDYFMEINFRNDGNAICVTAAGVNLPYIWYLANTLSGSFSHENFTKVSTVFVMPEFNDYLFVRRKELSLISWLKDVRRTDRFMEFDKHDLKPFLTLLYNRLINKK